MNVLVIFDHPRRTSFSGAVLDAFVRGLTEAGHIVEIADLRTEGFDPRLGPEDEPDWDDSRKTYSSAVLAEQARIERNEALAFVFPVWWWSLPATTKGWIDRVWNNGWAYGEAKLPHSKALLLAVCGGDAELYSRRGYDIAMQTQLMTGIISYCGIREGAIECLYGSLGSANERQLLLNRANRLGVTF